MARRREASKAYFRISIWQCLKGTSRTFFWTPQKKLGCLWLFPIITVRVFLYSKSGMSMDMDGFGGGSLVF